MDIVAKGEDHTAPYYEGLERNELRYQRCGSCGNSQFYPRPRCVRCYSQELQWFRSQGTGTIHAFTIVHRAATPEFVNLVPYCVAVIDLDEGVQMVSNVSFNAAEELSIGAAVSVTFVGNEGSKRPYFVMIV